MKKAFLAIYLAGVLCLVTVKALAEAWDDYDAAVHAYALGHMQQALNGYLLLAEEGFALAQFQLGVMYFKGQGVDQDFTQAQTWFTKAAEQGNTEAQINLGFIFDQGLGVVQNHKKAFFWYRKAGEQGDANAQFNLGLMCEEGQGVVQDFIEAHKWYNLAGSNGHESATSNRENLEKRMTPTQIAEAQKRAIEWQAYFDRSH